ncbi:PREDICTED: uncharacterized protein KIAA1551 homolog [Chrysochloris asiatica]|uniref:Uncharacterized protein KIAA1551 homolog n=1 Tax=Chrysochloris asiatica TaxID=185453 RepID=A0A9B0X0L8_CHRAS|nr:PREDICTED: uncharacterized protein KIAA1551 homolog [Chrysochloris asiatica]
MNWNAKPESATMPPLYPKNQSSFLHQTSVNPLASPSRSSFNYPGSNQETCMFSSNSNPVSQPLLSIKNYAMPQQMSVSDTHNGTSVASQTLVERKIYPNVPGPKQLNHSSQTSSGVAQNAWLNAPARNPMHSHTGSIVSNQMGLGANTSNIPVLQNQFVTSNTYSMQLQIIPSNSVRGPVIYQGRNPSLSERQVNWPQQHTSNGLPFPDYRSLSKQHCYSQQRSLRGPTLQKQNPMLSAMLHAKNNSLSNFEQFFQSQQNAPPQQYAVPQIDNKPPTTTYDCKYASQPLQNSQHASKHSPMEDPQNQEAHITDILQDIYRGLQQQGQNPNKEATTIGNLCNLEVNGNVNKPADKPVRSLEDGVQTVAQSSQDKRMECGSSTSNQVLGTNVTKEGLVSDIEALIEMKKKFFELARKIKINKKLLMAAGCSKVPSHGESTQNSESPLKETSKVPSGPQLTQVTPKISEGQLTTVMKCAEESNRAPYTLNSNIQDINCKKFDQDKPTLLNSDCLEKIPVKDSFHDLQASLKTSAVEITQTLNSTQSPSQNVRGDQNLTTNSETVTAPQLVLFKEPVSQPANKKTLLSFFIFRDKNKDKIILTPKPDNFEVKANTQATGEPPNLKTMKIQSASNKHNFCLDQKSSTDGMSSKSDSHCSIELLTTCLSLWKKQPSEDTEEKLCNELKTNRTTVNISNPVDIYDKNPCAVVGNSQDKMLNNSEQGATLPVAMQNYEPSGTNITKGSELQIAIVSPLILSDVKALSVKGMTTEVLPETVYPVIKEGSVCSLQNQLAENKSVTAPLKANVNELVASPTPSTKISPVIQKEKQDKSTNCSSKDIRNAFQGKHTKSKVSVHSSSNADISVCPRVSGNQQVSYESSNRTVVSGDTLQIASICSLVEGELSYNSQIAKIFNCSSLDKIEPQKSLPDQQVISCRQQKEQLDETIANKNFAFQKEKIVQITDTNSKITCQSKSLSSSGSPSLKSAEAKGESLEEKKLECITNQESKTRDMDCLTVVQQDIPETDTPNNYTNQDPANSAVLNDKTSIIPTLYLHDQLSELLKEFPYGIEPVNSLKAAVGQQITDQISKNPSCDKTAGDSKDSTDEIKITVISSEQMKELFSEQDDKPNDGDNLIQPPKEKPSTEVGGKCDPKAHAGENHDSVVSNDQKDDIHCCALGWLSLIYEGVPQCQCNSIKNLASKENKKDPCFPLETNSCKQGDIASDRDITIVKCNSSPNKDLETSVTLPDGKNVNHEIQQDKSIKDKPKTKHSSSLKKGKESPNQFSSKCDKKLDPPLQSHKRKRKFKFHEVTFHSSSKMMKFCEQDSEESLHKKHTAQNSCPLKAKTVILTNKEMYKKNVPEKIKLKFKAGGSRYKLLENRKPDHGNTFAIERKKKHDKQEQNKNGGNSFQLYNSLADSSERTSVKEKTVLMKSSNSNVKSSDSKESSCKIKRVLTPKEYLERQKHKEAVHNKAKKSCIIEKMKNVPCNTEYIIPRKHSLRIEGCGKLNERDSSIQTSKESSNISTSHGKTFKTHHSEESKKHKSSKNVKEKGSGKQTGKIWMDKTKIVKHLPSINSEDEVIPRAPQAKDQRKQYLNRVAFKCIEQESISLSKLDNSPRKPNTDRERTQENKSKSLLPVRDTIVNSAMLEFKLCPDVLFENTNVGEEGKKLKPVKTEQAPLQVSGMKSKDAWLKCANKERRMQEANQKIDNKDLPKLKHPKRSISADGIETIQNTGKDSKEVFATFRKMYMEQKSRSLGNSPLQ